ncbi:MAG: hypothetical protein OCD01_18715 [Fibrobacterales bacterium]
MTKTALSLLLAFGIGFYIMNTFIAEKKLTYAAPTERVLKGEKKKQFKRDRKQWIKEMHRTSPDFEWNQHDTKTRRSLYETKQILFKTGRSGLPKELEGDWIERGSDNQTGRIKMSTYDPVEQVIYAGSGGGNIWKGGLDGSSWTCLNNEYRINDIRYLTVFYKEEKRRLFVMQGSPALALYSDDEGKSWKSSPGLENAQKWGNARKALRRDDGVIFLLVKEWDYAEEFYWGELASLYRSDDDGENFTRVYSVPEKAALYDIHSADNDGVYILRGTDLMYQPDDGPFEAISKVTNEYRWHEMDQVYLTGRGEYLYAAHHKDDNTEVYRSSDKGENWNSVGFVEGDKPFTQNSFFVSKLQPEDIYIGGVRLFKSNGAQKEFKRLNNWEDYYSNTRYRLHADIPALTSVITPTGEEMFMVSTDGGIYVSYDSFKTVINISLNGLRNSQYYGTYTNRKNWSTIVAGSQDQGVQRISDDTRPMLSLEQDYSGDYGHLVSSNGGQTLWMSYPGFVLCYPNLPNDKRFYIWEYDNADMSNHLWMPPLMADPENPQAVFVGGGTSHSKGAFLYHLTYDDPGFTYERIPFNFGEGSEENISAMGASAKESDRRYVMTNSGRFFWSDNGGEDWNLTEDFSGPKPEYFYGATITTHPKDEAIVVIGGSGYSNAPVYISKDGGESFKKLDSGLPETLVHDLEYSDDGHRLYAATEVGAYLYVDTLGTWFNMGGPDQVYWNVEFLEGIGSVRFATFGRGIWDMVHYDSGERVWLPPQQEMGVVGYTSDLAGFLRSDNTQATLLQFQGEQTHITVPSGATICEVYNIHGIKHLSQGVVAGEKMTFNSGLLAQGNYLIHFK